MVGTSQCKIGLSIKKIDYLYTDGLTGTVDLNIFSTNITAMYVGGINGDAGLILDDVYIDTLTIGGIGGNSKLIIKNSIIKKVVGINLNSGNVKIEQSRVNGNWYD